MRTTSFAILCIVAADALRQPLATRKRSAIVASEAGERSYGETSAAVKGLVASLTAVVNAIGGKASEPVARTLEFDALSSDEILAGLQRDFVENEYLWSGKITPELYDEECVFRDPTLSFAGLSTFESNLENLDPYIERFVPAATRRCELKSIQLLEDGEAVVAEWRMVGEIALPWRPRLDLDGRTRYSLGGEGNRITFYDESWGLTPWQALLQLVKPAA